MNNYEFKHFRMLMLGLTLSLSTYSVIGLSAPPKVSKPTSHTATAMAAPKFSCFDETQDDRTTTRQFNSRQADIILNIFDELSPPTFDCEDGSAGTCPVPGEFAICSSGSYEGIETGPAGDMQFVSMAVKSCVTETGAQGLQTCYTFRQPCDVLAYWREIIRVDVTREFCATCEETSSDSGEIETPDDDGGDSPDECPTGYCMGSSRSTSFRQWCELSY